VQIVDVDFVGNGSEPEFVGLTISHPSPHAATGHPHAETPRVVVSAIGVLGGGSAAEFAAPKHQRVLEHPSIFEVG
jgi:hypothetical protein